MKKYYLVYKTTCLLNGKIYIGKHETFDLNDGYLGSGVLIRRAIEKYGRENFKREILFECSSVGEMNAKEAELVNEDFLRRNDVYNLKSGGDGGWDFCNTPEHHNNIGNRRNTGFMGLVVQGQNPGRETIDSYSDEELKDYCRKISLGVRRFLQDHDHVWIGKHHSEETKRKMCEAHKKFHLQEGKCNSQFETKCMYNEQLRRTIHAKPEDIQRYLDEGWKLGAVYNWESHNNRERIRKEREQKLEKQMVTNKQLYTEMYSVYCQLGFSGVRDVFGYKFSQANFVKQCKRYVDDYIPQNGKKRGIKDGTMHLTSTSPSTLPHTLDMDTKSTP